MKIFGSIRTKMHIFVMFTVITVSLGMAIVPYLRSIGNIDGHFKETAVNTAKSLASQVDGDYISELRTAEGSDEYCKLRDEAEKIGNDKLVQEYLAEKNLWEQYEQTQDMIADYMHTVDQIKYLYINSVCNSEAVSDMYIVDLPERPLYQLGCSEIREEKLQGLDLGKKTEPVIYKGKQGWMCSAFSPVYTSSGELAGIVNCGISMDFAMMDRRNTLISLFLWMLFFTAVVEVIAVIFINKIVVTPLKTMAKEIEKFKPAEQVTYEKAGVMDLPIRSKDEVGVIYNSIRSMQTNIIDYLNDISALQDDKSKAEQDILEKEKQIGQLHEQNSRDPLTGAGSKSAYIRMADELTREITDGTAKFAVIMVDMNNLKRINDEYGHKAGDQYINGCCNIIRKIYVNSQIFRIGGDEFVIISKNSDYENRFSLAEKLKAEYTKSYENTDNELWLRFSAAIGMAEYASDDNTYELVFKRADKAMYEDKLQFKKMHGSYR